MLHSNTEVSNSRTEMKCLLFFSFFKTHKRELIAIGENLALVHTMAVALGHENLAEDRKITLESKWNWVSQMATSESASLFPSLD